MSSSNGESIFFNQNLRMILRCSKCYSEDRKGECYEAYFPSKIRCLFKQLLLVNWNIENMYFPFEDDIFLTEEKQSGNNANAVVKNFTDLVSEST